MIAYDHAFMELSYYAEPRLRGCLYYLLSQKLELQHRGSDLDYQLHWAVGKRTNLRASSLPQAIKRLFARSNSPSGLLLQRGCSAGCVSSGSASK